MKIDERKDDLFFENVWELPNPLDELAKNVSKKKKNLSDESFQNFLSNVQNLTVFSIIYMIRIRCFGPRELIKIFATHSKLKTVMEISTLRVIYIRL